MNPPIELESLVDIHDQPFVVVDQQFRVVIVNRAFEETYGITRSAAVGRACYSLIRGDDRPCPCDPQGKHCPFGGVFAEQGTGTSTRRFRDKENREHIVRIQAYPVRTTTGEVYVGELVQRDAMRIHPEADGTCAGPRMVGESPVFLEALDRLRMAAGTGAPVLLLGETGTGKELAAAYVHRYSSRSKASFQTLDCTALTAELFESEVFGHERGAFTGNTGEKPGIFELANGGTLFLDEIGDMPLALQSKLLRVLETGQFRRVGGTKMLHADVRIISATNRQLRDVPWFRSDLYYRIACVSVTLPSLAERRSDIPLLANELVERISQTSGQRFTVDKSALELLQAHDFPGNIRELRNLLWVATVNARGARITRENITAALPPPEGVNGSAHNPPALAEAVAARPAAATKPPSTPQERPPVRRKWQADFLAEVLQRHQGNRRAAAEELGVSERTIYRKLKAFDLASWILVLNAALLRLLEPLM